MPIPQPASGESQSAFMQRCMSDETMKREYPNNAQRVAVCSTQWQDKKKDKDGN